MFFSLFLSFFPLHFLSPSASIWRLAAKPVWAGQHGPRAPGTLPQRILGQDIGGFTPGGFWELSCTEHWNKVPLWPRRKRVEGLDTVGEKWKVQILSLCLPDLDIIRVVFSVIDWLPLVVNVTSVCCCWQWPPSYHTLFTLSDFFNLPCHGCLQTLPE